ncbi:MAG: acyltransferase family protein [Coriobacteriales bacterium]
MARFDTLIIPRVGDEETVPSRSLGKRLRESVPIIARPSSKRMPRIDALDGLRVLAIVAILIYHAHVEWLPGGFIGVTTFFVLTGYLITNSLVHELKDTGRLRLWKFYCKRIRRLWPTMIVTVLGTAVICAVFAPHLLDKMRPDVLPSLLFADNWWYIFNEQSYFAAAGQPSPLTHFWYLGVVGQFYLVWPLLILAVWKAAGALGMKRPRRLLAVLAFVLLVVSAALMVLLIPADGDVSRVYYGTDTRCAELMVGALASLVIPPVKRRIGAAASPGSHSSAGKQRLKAVQAVLDVVAVLALAALVVMAIRVDGFTSWMYTGGFLLVAVLTAVMVFAVSNRTSWVGRILGKRAFKTCGARAFAIYMWHYPLLLVMNPATRTTELPWWGWVLELAVIIVVAEFSYRFVEQTFGGGRIGKTIANLRSGRVALRAYASRYRMHLIATGLFAIVAVSLIILGPMWQQEREEARAVHENVQIASIDEGDIVETMFNRLDTVDKKTGASNLRVLLIGDSVALDAESDFYKVFPNGKMDAKISRQLFTGDEFYNENIAAGYKPEIVVYALGTNGLAVEDEVRENIEVAGDLPVYLVNNRVPEAQETPNNELFARLADEYSNVSIIDWYEESTGHDEWFWSDGTHVRPDGAEAYADMLKRYIVG